MRVAQKKKRDRYQYCVLSNIRSTRIPTYETCRSEPPPRDNGYQLHSFERA